MPAISPSYLQTDAWVLYAVIHASRNEPASLAKIIEVGDHYNHAIFTDAELHGGIDRLNNGGWIVSRQHLFSITTKSETIYSDVRLKKLSCFDEMKALSEKLNSDPVS